VVASQHAAGGRPRNFRLTGRSLARNQALQILFQAEACNRSAEDVLADEFVLGFDAASDDDNTLPAGPLDPYAEYLALGVDEYRHELDGVISSASENWSISRMSAVDRNLLRIAVFEMRESKDNSLIWVYRHIAYDPNEFIPIVSRVSKEKIR
jgi:transcription termination factor NusB